MKQLLHIFFLSVVLVCLSACESPVPEIVGKYDFKISGNVTQNNGQIIVLTNEAGDLQVTHLTDNTLLLTFNTTDGSAYTTQATIEGNQLELNPFARVITITKKTQESNILGIPIELIQTEVYNTEVYGYGTIYGETIHFHLQYSGAEFTGSKKIVGNNIFMIANKK